MSLNDSQLNIFEKAFAIEKHGVIQFLKEIDLGSQDFSFMDLYDLQDEKHEEKVKDLLKKLYRDRCTEKQLLNALGQKKKLFLDEYDEDLISDASEQSGDFFGIDHLNFEWTGQMIKEAKTEEDQLQTSVKLKTWEHGYKEVVKSGANIQELDDSIKSLIANHLRNTKAASRKRRSRKRSSRKRRSSRRSSRKSSKKRISRRRSSRKSRKRRSSRKRISRRRNK